MRIYFDVLGTLLSTDGRELRPGTADLLKYLSEAGHEIVLWSTAGANYARAFARRFGLNPWLLDYQSKHDFIRTPDFCVDDHPGYLKGSRGNALVEPYQGGTEDRALKNVREAIRKLMG